MCADRFSILMAASGESATDDSSSSSAASDSQGIEELERESEERLPVMPVPSEDKSTWVAQFSSDFRLEDSEVRRMIEDSGAQTKSAIYSGTLPHGKQNGRAFTDIPHLSDLAKSDFSGNRVAFSLHATR